LIERKKLVTRRLGLFIALLGMSVALTTPHIAYADPPGGSDATTEATVWYDPITHPVPHGSAARSLAVVTPMATGGGCAQTYGARACISYSGGSRTLNADFYVDSLDHISNLGKAYVYISVNGTTNYRYTTAINQIGHYPVTSLDVGSGSGSAYTIVDFYNSVGEFLMSASSPTQWYP
jgi:hypothetical protein